MSEPAGFVHTRRTGDLVVIVLLAAFVALYCVDAIRASTDILNLILVLPLSVTVLALCLAQFWVGSREARDGALNAAVAAEPAATDEGALSLAEVLPVVGLFAVYVLTLPWVGFDAGTCLFLAAFLWWHGERRWPWLIAYSLSFSFLIALFFSRMLPYPMPMLLLGTG